MVLLKVGTGVYVCADEIVLLQSFPSRPARRDKQAAESAGQYKDATTAGSRREPLRTLVHLRCGLLVGSPITADALAKRSPVSSPIKMTTRRNNLEHAQIVDGQGAQADGQGDAIPVERAPAPPHRHPKKTRVGAARDELEEATPDEEVGTPNEEAGAPSPEPDEAPSPDLEDDENKPRRGRGFGGFKRLIGRE